MTRRRKQPRPKTPPGKAAPEEAVPQVPSKAGVGQSLWWMVGLSGFACLVYQILWMRQLGLLLGNTSQAAALTLGVFFGGLAAGSWFWGGRSPKLAHPLRLYGYLEFGIAAWGLAVLVGPSMIEHSYPFIYQRHGPGALLNAFNLCWTLLMVLPPAVMMGGTMPVVGQAVIRHASVFGSTTAKLYAINTLGAASGAFAAAFVLIATVGVRMTCVVAMIASALAGMLALRLSKKVTDAAVSVALTPVKVPPTDQSEGMLPRSTIRLLAFVSGFNLLALEVLWTRMLAQVHENSVYSFSAILIVVLACLSLGSWIASRLARWASSAAVLVVLSVIGGTALGMLPFLFTGMSDNMKMLATDTGFGMYIFRLFGMTVLSIGPACLLLGTIFPYLMKCEERFAADPGKSIGILSAINTLGAILGALAAGFILLEWLGLWRSMQWIASVYLVIGILIPAGKSDICRIGKVVAAVVIALSFTILSPSNLPPAVTLDNFGKQEELVEKWEASDSTVSVVKDSQDHLSIKINSHYSLGSSYAIAPQIYQARIPLLAFPQSESLFFLGLGTGITAGEALDRESYPNVSKVVACELSPSVVAASKKYFGGGAGEGDLTRGLYKDARAKVITEDGRKLLMATGDRFSMINADLFVPYQRGTGSLYSREHFENAKERLKPAGVFVQWLPLYQISEREFGMIARTMISVFPQVSLWRGNFQPGAELAAFVGHADMTPIPACALDVAKEMRAAVEGADHGDMHRLMLPINEQTVLMFYGGNLTAAADLFSHYPINSDDRPMIEFGTPRSLHRPAEEGKPQFLQDRFARLVDRVQERCPPGNDPLLSSRTPESRKLPLAGSAFHRAWIARVSGDEGLWMKEWEAFLKHWLPSEAPEANEWNAR